MNTYAFYNAFPPRETRVGDFGLETILVYTDLQLTLNCDKAQILNILP